MRGLLKHVLFWLADFLQLPTIYLKMRGPVATIALYHGVSPEINQGGIFNYRKKFINPENFRSQLIWLKNNYKIISLSTLIELLQNKKVLTENILSITFDDGYENIYKHAFPALKELELPATIFIATDLIDKQEPLWVDRLEYSIGNTDLKSLTVEINSAIHSLPTNNYQNKCKTDIVIRQYLKNINNEKKGKLLIEIENQSGKKLSGSFNASAYKGLSWEQVQEMSENEIDFAPHTKSHPILSKLSVEEINSEIIESYNLCRRKTDRILKIFAYPNGQEKDFNQEIIDVLKKNGFVAALTTVPGTIKLGVNLYSLPRFSLDESDNSTFFRITISGIRSSMQSIRDTLNIKSMCPGDFFNKDADSYLAEYSKGTPEGFSFRERKRLTLGILRNIQDKNILDIGSGPGIIIEELLNRGAKITAIDIAPNMIELLKSRFKHKNLVAKTGNIENIDSPDNSYDYVTALGVLEYLETDEKALSEIKRVLKKNGEAIASFPNYYSPWRIWNRILLATFGLPWRLLKNLTGENPHPIKHQEYTKKQIVEIIENSGLKIIKITGYNFKVTPLPFDRLFPQLTIKLADKLKDLANSKLNWLATAYLVRIKNL